MRNRLLEGAMGLVAKNGPGSTSIDDVIAAVDVSRGTFYKYFPSPEALVKELALEITNELIKAADPVVLKRVDPAERLACGIRLVSRLAIAHPLMAACLARMGWPDARGPHVQLAFVQRDLEEGIRLGRFKQMPMALALNIVAGAVLGATHSMLQPNCEPDFAEQTTEAALRALGLDAASAHRIATAPADDIFEAAAGIRTRQESLAANQRA